MRQIEQWKIWKRDFSRELFIDYNIESIHDVIGEFFILLVSVKDPQKKMKILYVHSVESHRRTNVFLENYPWILQEKIAQVFGRIIR